MEQKTKIYLGTDQYNEELYINLEDKSLDGCSLMGLRPATEEELRINARETEITEIYNIPEEIKNYIDYDKFSNDMEEEWLNHHDSQGEYIKEGEIYYLGFGSGTDIYNYFKENDIKTFEDWITKLEYSNINEKQFKELTKIMKEYKENKEKGYKKFLKWTEKISEYPPNTTQ